MTSMSIKVLAIALSVFMFTIFYIYYLPSILNRNKDMIAMDCKKEIDDYSLDEQIHKFMFIQDKLYEEINEE